MITHTPAELSRILWTKDPMGTCCNVNEGMEDEYDDIAADIIRWSKLMSVASAVKLVITSYFDDYLYNYHKEELDQCLS
jgi:hypothetical protein